MEKKISHSDWDKMKVYWPRGQIEILSGKFVTWDMCAR